MKFGWRQVLPVAHVLLAVGLFGLGHLQLRAHMTTMAQEGVQGEFDYFTPAELWLTVIDAPAFVVSIPFVAPSRLPATVSRTIFVLAIAAQWYWLGLQLDKKMRNLDPTSNSTNTTKSLPQLGIGLVVCSVLVLIALLDMFKGTWPKVIAVSFLAWAVVLGLILFSQRMTQSKQGGWRTL